METLHADTRNPEEKKYIESVSDSFKAMRFYPMNEYLLTLRIKFQAIDDPAARAAANKLLQSNVSKLYDLIFEDNVKLQQLIEGQPPRKLVL